MRSPFQPRTRDSRLALSDSLARDLAIMENRFQKAQALADALEDADPALDPSTLRYLDNEDWVAASVLAGVSEPSTTTRLLVTLILQDRQQDRQRSNLHVEGESCLEYVQANCEPRDVWPK